MLTEFRVDLQELLCCGTSLLQHGSIIGEARKGKIGKSGLPGPEDLTGATEAEIHLSDLKTIGGANHHILPLRDEVELPLIETVGRCGTAADTATQLMELCQTESIGMINHHHTGGRDIHTDLHHGC